MRTLKAILLCLLIAYSLCEPRTDFNKNYNVNFNTQHNPQEYYGEWKNHKYYESPDDWRKETIYQFITDRFCDGTPQNNDGPQYNFGGYDLHKIDTRHGGDFAGITKKLDYIKSLGFTAIWISPVFQNLENSYHGYGQIDFTIVDDRMGSLDDFRAMVETAHKKGIKVIVDIIVNHMSDLYYFEGHESSQAPFKMHDDEYKLIKRGDREYADFQVDNTFNSNGKYCSVYGQDGYEHKDQSGSGSYWDSDFHHNGDLVDYGDPYCNNLGKIYGMLDDLRTTHSRVRDKIIAMTKSLVTSTDIDGIRMDTPMQVPLDFFKEWVPAVRKHAESLGKKNFLLFAEFFCSKEFAATMTGRGKTPAMYSDPYKFISDAYTFDGGINYPSYQWYLSAIKEQNGGVKGLVTSYFDDYDKFDWYRPSTGNLEYRHCNFFNNHDQWRMASTDNDGFKKQDLSMHILLSFPGIPLYYYGDEQEFLTMGTALDGYSREDMMTSVAWVDHPTRGIENKANIDNFDMAFEEFVKTRKMNTIRKVYDFGVCDKVMERYVQPDNSNGLLFFSRNCGGDKDDKQWILFGFNSWKETLSTVEKFQAFNSRHTLVNVFDESDVIELDSDGYLPNATLQGYEFKMYVTKENLRSLNPFVTSMYPEHDSVATGTIVYFTLHYSTSIKSDVKSGISASEGLKIVSIDHSGTETQIKASILKDGIHKIFINEDYVISSDSGLKMVGSFESRIRYGNSNNIIVFPNATTDANLAQVRSQSEVQFNHKAKGAEFYRVYISRDEKWSDWMDYADTTTYKIDTSSTYLTVQYWADGSAAYFVDTKI